MASVASETLILFIASLLVAASVAGTMTQSVDRFSGALSDQSSAVTDQVRTDVEIISDAGSPSTIYDETNGTVTLLVKNTGTQALATDPDTIDVLVDGTYRSNVTTEVVDGDAWRTDHVIRLTVNETTLEQGDHRVVVIVNGNRETLRFRV